MTYIKKMRLRGFKSFAKPLDLEFGNDFNCVIGPNGSGKSNIMDALTFVLGKLSAKSMRAERSSNLIFNGGKKGSPMKEAEVSIFFDNSQKEFPLKDKDIKITRLIKQKGTSVYKINDEVRTRQQILDLLYNAKIDPSGHNIVLQGDIVRFMEMKTDERREVIEDIAGISVFDEKKHKALLELEKVDGKLNEASIILKEREAYLKELKKERDQAIKYKELEKNVKSNKATVLNIQIKEKESKRSEIESRIEKNQKEVEKISSRIQDITSKIKQNKEDIEKINKEIEEKSEIESVKLQKEIEELRTSEVRSSERLSTCKNEIEKINSRTSQLKDVIKETEKNINDLLTSKKELEERESKLLKKEDKLEDELKSFKGKHGVFDTASLDKLEQDIDSLQKSILTIQEKKSQISQKKFKIEAQIQSLNSRIKQISSSDTQKLKTKHKEVSKELQRFLNEDSVTSSQLSKKRTEINNLNSELFKIQAKSASQREFISSDRALNAIIKSKIKGVHGTIMELGKVDSKHSLALQIVAGPRSKAVVVESDKTAAECIKQLKQKKLGTCIFLPLNKIRPSNDPKISGSGVQGLALNLISFNPKYKNAFSYVFGSTYIVDNVETARKIGVGRARMVTLDGDLFETSGAIQGGFRKRLPVGSFKEKDSDNKINKIESEISQAEKTIDILEKRKSELENKIYNLREEKAIIEGEFLKIEKSSDGMDLNKLEKEKSALEQDKIFTEFKDIELEIAGKVKEIDSLRKEKQKSRSALKDLRNPRIADDLNKLEARKEKTREEIIQLKTDIKNIEVQISNIYNPEKERTLEIIKEQEKDLTNFIKESKELEENLRQTQKQLKDKENVEQRFQKEYRGLFEKRNNVSQTIQKLESSTTIENSKIREIENKINGYSISKAKITGELEGLNYEFEEFKGTALRRGLTIEQLKSEIRKFDSMMEKMGNVNLKALEVYDQIHKEYEAITNKTEKLRTEKEAVLKMMDEIETKKKKIFMKTYKVIGDNFNRIFLSLSTKGEAFLELENKEDPLSAGIEIKVRLVGNKYLDIKSLSGGEKTLAALAFIFAIQEHEPASFYLLDEVDAALDKTNSQLLSKLVKKYASNAQYVLISHNDEVISEASQIYGVSMQENGMSKVVSLKI